MSEAEATAPPRDEAPASPNHEALHGTPSHEAHAIAPPPTSLIRADDLATQKLEQLNDEFSSYLRSYAQVSLDLLGRWPAFVPEEHRNEHGLNNMDAFSTGPELPAQADAGTASGNDDAEVALHASNAKMMQLREQIVKLGAKLRKEVAERTKATNENLRRGKQLQSMQHENRVLADSMAKQAQQLEAAREVTLKLEEELRVGKKQVEEAEGRLQKEKKARHVWQMRTEKMQKQLQPMLDDSQTLSHALRATENALAKAEADGYESKRTIAKLMEEKERLVQRAVEMRRAMDNAKEETAEAGLHITLLADRREEMVEEIESLRGEVSELENARRQLEGALKDAKRSQEAERKARLEAEAVAAESRNKAEAEAQRAARRQADNERSTAELQTHKQYVATLMAQDAIREAEQRKLFDTVSELLGRVQYLGSVPPEDLGIGAAEAYHHRTEAVRHLRALREAHSLSTFSHNLVMAPATMAMGAAMLKNGPELTARRRSIVGGARSRSNSVRRQSTPPGRDTSTDLDASGQGKALDPSNPSAGDGKITPRSGRRMQPDSEREGNAPAAEKSNGAQCMPWLLEASAQGSELMPQPPSVHSGEASPRSCKNLKQGDPAREALPRQSRKTSIS